MIQKLSQRVAAAVTACALLLTCVSHGGIISLSGAKYTIAAGGQPSTFFGATLPTLPALQVPTAYSLPTGNTWTATNTSNNNAAGTGSGNRTGSGLQYAIDNAALNDVITVTAGATYTGPFTLKNKTTGSGWIYIQTSGYSSLPGVGVRVAPSDATNMAKIVISDFQGGAIQTADNANHYRLVGLEIAPVAGQVNVFNLVDLGGGYTNTALVPSYVVIDRSYIHGNSGENLRRTVAMNMNYVAVINSYLTGAKDPGYDTQAAWAYNCQGPILIDNNYLEAAAEVVLFGGAQPPSLNAAWIPSDITITNNTLYKSTATETGYISKNLFELKLGIRVLFDHNHMENQTGTDQKAAAVLFTPRDEAGAAPFFPGAAVQDVTFTNNRMLNVGQCWQISGGDDGDHIVGRTSQQLQRVLVRNNLCSMNFASDGRLVVVTGIGNSDHAPLDLIIDHNTALNGNGTPIPADSLFAEVTATVKTYRFVFTNNIFHMGSYGWSGTSQNQISGTYAAYFDPNYITTANSFIATAATGQTFSEFPSGNYNTASIAAVQFTDYAAGDWSLSGASPYKGVGLGAPGVGDGSDLGANLSQVAP